MFLNLQFLHRTLKCFTWEKESHGLFDYESKTTIKNTYTIIEPGKIPKKLTNNDKNLYNLGKVLREKNEIKFIKQNISYVQYFLRSQ